MTNLKYTESNELFRLACQLADIRPSKRQASKFRRNMGKAFRFNLEAARKLKEVENEIHN